MGKFGQFIVDYLSYILKGSSAYYAWLLFLLMLVGAWGYTAYVQLMTGLAITGLSDQVSWGLYLSNFVFLVGVAAGAVTVVFPAYVYHHESLHKVAVLGEMLAVSAVVMCALFIISHMGRPDRLWHLIPYLGIFNFPSSVLTWDIIVLLGYLILNLIGGFYFLYKTYADAPLNRRFYMPIIYISIVWAISIHTVTAFFINTMPARSMWHHGMMPIRFITTAFAAGPALIVVIFSIIRNSTRLWIEDNALEFLTQIVVWCLGIALFLTFSEVVTELYFPTEHSSGLRFLMFGLHGFNEMVPWFWSSAVMMSGSFILLLIPSVRRNYRVVPYICLVVFVGIWIEKGMGLLIPGSIPTPIGEFSVYRPTKLEILYCVAIWGVGFLVLTLLLKGAIGIILGELRYGTRRTHTRATRARPRRVRSVRRPRRVIAPVAGLALLLIHWPAWPWEPPCIESIADRATEIVPQTKADGTPDIRCSPTTHAVLWYEDPFTRTVPMGPMPVDGDYNRGEAVVRPREERIILMPLCGVNCHEGTFPLPPKDKNPRELWMHKEIASATKLQHGKGALWCLDCHSMDQRNKLVDNFGAPVGMNQPQLLCGKCHGSIFRDWREGIHGKRIGEWASNGKKRWFVCTECHNPHDVQQGARNSGFRLLNPEPAPLLPLGTEPHENGEEEH